MALTQAFSKETAVCYLISYYIGGYRHAGY